MSSEKNKEIKTRLHPRNRNRKRYDLNALISTTPSLSTYVEPNKYGDDSVNFSNPIAVRLLNKALLKHYYGIKFWEFSEKNLCPAIPGRADYIHHIADLLRESNNGTLPLGNKITCFDIGVGASCIYPVIGVTEYNWNFIGSDINKKSIKSAQEIVKANASLNGKIECRLQEVPKNVFYGVIPKDDSFDISICNPPFHSSVEEAKKGSRRKVKNLSGKKEITATLNFSGINEELVCVGGEYRFIHNMIRESKKFAKNAYWFSSLVSKQSNLKSIYKLLEKFETSQIKTIPMGTGNKSVRIVAWSFLSIEEQKEWRESRWN